MWPCFAQMLLHSWSKVKEELYIYEPLKNSEETNSHSLTMHRCFLESSLERQAHGLLSGHFPMKLEKMMKPSLQLPPWVLAQEAPCSDAVAPASGPAQVILVPAEDGRFIFIDDLRR